MKKLIFLAMAVVSGIYSTASIANTPVLEIPANGLILAVGDSLTSGYGVGKEMAWPALLQEITGVEVVNAARNGASTDDLKRSIRRALNEHRPFLVVATIGGNDLLRRQDLSRAERNIRDIAKFVIAMDADFLILAPPAPGETEAHPAYRKALGDLPYSHVDQSVLPIVFGDRALMHDEIHPNAEGHKIIADAVSKWFTVVDAY